MSSFRPRHIRAFSFDAFHSNEPEVQDYPVIYKYIEGEDLIQVRKDAINIVLSRNIRRNVRIASDIAVGVHELEDAPNVLYVNSYAGERLLWDAFSATLQIAGITADLSPLVNDTTDSKSDIPSSTPLLANLRIFDSPIGCWDTFRFRQELKAHPASVVILNSFEFTTLSRSQREKFARDLLQLQLEFGLTIVVFSHEMKKDIQPNMPGRGAIGILAACAESVARVGEPALPIKTGNVHENKTQPALSTTNIDASQALDGVSHHYGDYWEDPWKGIPQRSGSHLALYARTPRLRKHYLEHPLVEYERGDEPTEEGLKWTEEGRAKYSNHPKVLFFLGSWQSPIF